MVLTSPIPLLLILILSPKLNRILCDGIMGSWYYCLSGWLYFMCGVRIRQFGDLLQPNQKSLIIMNHRTRLDWLWLFLLLAPYGMLNGYRISLISLVVKKLIPLIFDFKKLTQTCLGTL